MKREIRKRILTIRKNLKEEIIAQHSKAITEKIKELKVYEQAELVLVYMNAKGEISTKEIIQDAWQNRKKVAAPKVHEKEMAFYEICSFNELEEGYFEILEPKKTCPEVTPENCNAVVLMPGVAFDAKCNRIGYGGGYYDKYFKKYPEVYKIALAHELQLVSEIPAEKFDIKPDLIMTEQNIYKQYE